MPSVIRDPRRDAGLSEGRRLYLSARRRRRAAVMACQIGLLLVLLIAWEVLARLSIIDSFIMSQPSRIAATLLRLGSSGLLGHVAVTVFETLVGFALGAVLGSAAALMLWWSDFLARVAQPWLVVLGALPKIALGPVIIVWVGAGQQAIIVMALGISLIVTVLEMLSGFLCTDEELIKMARTLGATKRQTFVKIVFPSNLGTLFGSLKVNLGLSLVGVIAGEFLVSRAGLGYLIVYGGQVFQMDLVMTSVLILAALAAALYKGITALERAVMRAVSHG